MSATPSMHPVRCLAVAWSCMALLAAPAQAERAWPSVELPTHARSWSVGDGLEVNGMPMRIRGFVSDRPLGEVARVLRQGLGAPVVENHRGDQLIMGHADRGFFTTVQLERVSGGTRGLVAVADLEGAVRGREQAQRQAQRWLRRLPPDSSILSQTSSRDGPRLSSQLVFSNGAGGALNSQALTALMRQDGLRLEHEAMADTAMDTAMDTAPQARVLWFKGVGQEATAVIGRLPDGRVRVVLNTVKRLEATK